MNDLYTILDEISDEFVIYFMMNLYQIKRVGLKIEWYKEGRLERIRVKSNSWIL